MRRIIESLLLVRSISIDRRSPNRARSRLPTRYALRLDVAGLGRAKGAATRLSLLDGRGRVLRDGRAAGDHADNLVPFLGIRGRVGLEGQLRRSG